MVLLSRSFHQYAKDPSGSIPYENQPLLKQAKAVLDIGPSHLPWPSTSVNERGYALSVPGLVEMLRCYPAMRRRVQYFSTETKYRYREWHLSLLLQLHNLTQLQAIRVATSVDCIDIFNNVRSASPQLRVFFGQFSQLISTLKPEEIRALPSSLETLGLYTNGPTGGGIGASAPVCEAIASHFPKLSTLVLETDEITAFQSKTSLTDLTVISAKLQPLTLAKTTPQYLPPNVGFNLGVNTLPLAEVVTPVSSLFSIYIAEQRDPLLEGFLTSGKFDINRPQFVSTSFSSKRPPLGTALLCGTNLSASGPPPTPPLLLTHLYREVLKILIKSGADVNNVRDRAFDFGLDLPRPPHSLFGRLLFCSIPIPRWTEVAQWLFTESGIFERELASTYGGDAKRALSLPTPTEAKPWSVSILHSLVRKLRFRSSLLIIPRIKFLLGHPDLFGCHINDPDLDGCNLAHGVHEDVRDYDLEWDLGHIDHTGRDTIECLAYHGASEAVVFHLARNASLWKHITSPVVWGVIGETADEEQFQFLLDTLLQQDSPEDLKKQCIVACINVQLRISGIQTVNTLLMSEKPNISRWAAQGLVEGEFDLEKAKKDYAGLKTIAPTMFKRFDLPTPHAMDGSVDFIGWTGLLAVFGTIASKVGQEKVDEWLEKTVDHRGDNMAQARARAAGSRQHAAM